MTDAPPPNRSDPSASWTDPPGPAPEPTPPAPPAPPPPMPVVYLLGILGSFGGIVAAMIDEVAHATPLLGILLAPAIEEICKPIAVIFMLEKRPHWLRSPRHVIALSLLGAGIFATIENLMYIHIYHPNPSTEFILWRYGVCTALHLVASGVMGVGLARALGRIRTEGASFSVDLCLRYYIAAVAIHAAYNTTVTILSAVGVLKF